MVMPTSRGCIPFRAISSVYRTITTLGKEKSLPPPKLLDAKSFYRIVAPTIYPVRMDFNRTRLLIISILPAIIIPLQRNDKYGSFKAQFTRV